MKRIHVIGLFVILLVVGGKGLAQTSSTNEKKAAPFYAIAELGTGISVSPYCAPLEFTHSLGLGIRLGKSAGIGINHHMTVGVSQWGYSSRKFRGLSIHSFVRWRKIRLMLEAGKVTHYEDGCNDEQTGYYFRSRDDSFNPYFRISPSFQPTRNLYFFLSFLQTLPTEGIYSSFSIDTDEKGPARLSLQSLQFGVGCYLGP
ncbi:MAG: hypothetical protein AB8H47_21455 [Bacteroidia bacterium]